MALTAKTVSTARAAAQLSWRGFDAPAAQYATPGDKICVTALWDDTTDGHIPTGNAIGLGVWLPVNFAVTRVDFHVLIVPVGPTNMFLSLENDQDLITSAAIAGAPWSTTGIKSGANADAGAVQVAKTVQGPITTLPRELLLAGTVAPSSAGRIAFFIEGHISFSAVQGAVV